MRLRWLVIALIATGCSSPDAPPASDEPSAHSVSQEPGALFSSLDAQADQRRIGGDLEAALAHPRVEARRRAARAISHIRSDDSLHLLRAALRDTDPQVRSHATAGLAGLADHLPVDLEPTLLAALAAESDPGSRAAITHDLGRVGTADAIPAIVHHLASDDAASRAAACRAFSEYGLRHRNVPEDILRRVAARVVDDPEAETRLYCAHALAQLPLPVSPDARRALSAELLRALADTHPEVRYQALGGLARYPETSRETLARFTRDEDWRVRIKAFRALSALSFPTSDRELAAALRFQIDAWQGSGQSQPTDLRVLLEAMRLSRPVAGNHATYQVAQAALERFARPPIAGDEQAHGLLHCAAASLVDHGRSWPSRIDGCGHGRVSDGYRKAEIAGVLAMGRGSESQRMAQLDRLFEHPDERVREAVMAALPSVLHPRSGLLILRGVEDGDIGVKTAALHALGVGLRRWARLDGARRVTLLPNAAAVDRALAGAHAALVQADHLHGLAEWIDVAGALPIEPRTEAVQLLGLHWNAEIRRSALSLLRRHERPEPEGPVAPVPNPIAPERVPEDARSIRIRLATPRGAIVMELLPTLAPVTVARFLDLFDSGFYDGLTFHRVLAATLVEGGDPRADGHGGPGWTQRSEESRLAFTRGVVGMSLELRDGAGSRFFVAQRAMPERDGRYTAFGRVVEGMDVVDALLPGDTIDGTTRVSRENTEPPSAPNPAD